jgi:hypothetical protein
MKHFLGGFFWMVSAVMLMGANITVTSPNGGENWQQGQSRQITWTSTGITSGTFQVTLWKGGISQGVVASGLPCTQHAFNWTVGQLENAPVAVPGPGYTIKVRLQNQTPSDFSNAAFTISAPLPAGVIAVTCPNGGEDWQQGQSRQIKWTSTGITSGTFQVTLWKGGISQGVVASGLPCTSTPSTGPWGNWKTRRLRFPVPATPSKFVCRIKRRAISATPLSPSARRCRPAPSPLPASTRM